MKMKKVCIIGLGYVGLPLACLAAEKGYTVTGVDVDSKKVESINKGISPLEDEELKEKVKRLKGKITATTEGVSAVKDSDISIICVPTPIDKNYMPDLSCVKSAAETIAKGLKKGHLVVLESTVAPGTTETDVKGILEKSGLKAGKDFLLAFCPERIDPGNKRFRVSNIPRVLGGINEESAKKAAEFYKSILDAEVLTLSSVKAAEAVKIMENSFRDVNIAFVNEMAKSFDKFGIDVTEVIKGASTKPFSFMAHYPGCGVGGHCIAVDPYYMIEDAKRRGFDHKLLKIAREINNSMPEYTIGKVIDGLKELGMGIKGVKVTVLGLAYKGNVDDMRESPAVDIIERLKALGADVKVFDPHVLGRSDVKSLDDALKSEVVVIATDHNEFKKLDLGLLKKNGVRLIVDGRNLIDKAKAEGLGLVYRGIGR